MPLGFSPPEVIIHQLPPPHQGSSEPLHSCPVLPSTVCLFSPFLFLNGADCTVLECAENKQASRLSATEWWSAVQKKKKAGDNCCSETLADFNNCGSFSCYSDAPKCLCLSRTILLFLDSLSSHTPDQQAVV